MTLQPSPKLLRPFVALLLAIAAILVAAPSFAQEAKKEAKKKYVEKTFRARSYPRSGERTYDVHLPSNYNPAETLPLVMVLHGCLECGGPPCPFPFLDRATIEHDSKFDDVADQERFIVVYPNRKLDPLSGALPFCWEFWEEAQGDHRGQGDVADLYEIVKEVQQDYKVDPNRIHIAGLSSGACMTVAALVAYPDIFASGSPTAGLPYNETKAHFNPWNPGYKPVDQLAAEMRAEMDGRMRPVPIFIIQSEADQTVNPKYADNIRDSWGKAFGVDTQNPISPPESGETKGTSWTHTKYGKGSDGNTVVETLILHRRPDGGLPHGWYGDNDGEIKPPLMQSFAFSQAPDTAQLAWEFFKAHPMPPKPPSSPSAADTPR